MNNSFVKKVENYHPLSQDYINYWKSEKRKCVEGDWAGGYYVPPALYFYANYATIRLNKGLSDIKTFEQPWIRDVEWSFFQAITIARGFSGFEDDPNYTCLHLVNDPNYPIEKLKKLYPYVFKPNGELKTYEDPKTYIARKHDLNYVIPCYHNPKKNFLLFGSRGGGKSYMVGGGVIPHSFLTDGAIIYNPGERPSPVEILVGSSNSDKSADLLLKVKHSMDMLPGKQVINGRTYPSPLAKQYSGSWAVNSEIRASYKIKASGGWEEGGSKSSIKHRSFNDNPFAAQGTRPLWLILEEFGLMANGEEVYRHAVDTMRDGLRKIGSLIMLGTGGQMESGTIPAYKMFYNPDKYDILPFEDVWEHTPAIGYFLPAYLTLNEHKDDDGITNVPEALEALEKERERLRGKHGASDALNKEIIYRPIVPSEIFLSKSSTVFPTVEIRKRLTEVLTKNLHEERNIVELFFSSSSKTGVEYKVNNTLIPIDTYPFDGETKEGAIIVYEFPKEIDGQIPPDAYMIGCDPYKDDSQSGHSFASIYVVKTSRHPQTIGHNEIVASYVGRPYLGKNQVNEILFKLSLFYGNAKIYFENNVGNVKDYFERVRRLDLLAVQPTTIFNKKASYNTGQPLVYGYTMGNEKVKWEALQYFRAWLLEPRSDGVLNLDLIKDVGLLQELSAFTMKGNFDRVMSCLGWVLGLEETHNKAKAQIEQRQINSLISKEFLEFIVNNKRIFNAKLPTTTSVL